MNPKGDPLMNQKNGSTGECHVKESEEEENRRWEADGDDESKNDSEEFDSNESDDDEGEISEPN